MPLAAALVMLTVMPLAHYGQFCAATVPTFTVDLTGNPDSVWLSPPTVRIDTCCGVTNPDRCVQFIVTLDTLAQGVVMDIPEGGGCGARPTGSLFYQVNCGPQIAIGTPVCLSGPGPHFITFCKPGNNDNCYQITSFPGPGTSGDAVATDGCNALLGTVGYVPSSIQWRSIPSNPLWESYLSCTDSCDTTTATALVGAPPFVDYQVCGRPIGDCDTTPICDTLRVFFVTTLGVIIQPDSPTVCFGAGTTNISANVIGGAAPYTYVWTSGGVPVGGNSPVLAVGPGTFTVAVTDTLNCAIARDTVVVTEFSLPILALAGNDFAVCVGDSIFLSGQVQAASGGIWSGGGGTFTPNASTLNAAYFPSPTETAAGFVNLTLTTTGNGTCPAASDAVRVDIVPYPTPVISGPTPVCQFTTASYTTPAVPGHTYLWAVSGGSIASGQGSSTLSVNWAGAGAGSLTLTQTNQTGCDSTVALAIVIQPRPNPALSGPATVCQFDQATYAVPFTPGNTYLWAVTGGSILNGQNSTSLDVQWGAAGGGQISLTETNAFGCDTTVLLTVTIQPKPAPVLSGPASSCAWSPASYSVPAVAGHAYTWSVSGGSLLSGQGTNAVSVQWQAAGPGSISVLQTHPSGCDTTVSLAISVLPNPVALLSGPDSICAFSPAISYTSPANAGAAYAWTISGGSILSGQGSNSIQVAWAAAGSGSLGLLVTLPSGCDTTVSLPVTILPKPTPVPAGPTVACAFRPQVYSTPAMAGDSYLWTVSGGAITSGQGSNSITVQWAGAGSGTVTVLQSNAVGCDSSRSLAVSIFPTPQPVLSGPSTACAFTGGHVYSSPALPGYGYLWSVSGGGITGGQGSNSITVAWAGQGSGSVTLTQTAPAASGGCDTTVTIPVTVHPVPNPLIAGPLSVCAFSNGSVYSTPVAAGDTYLWTVSGGTISGGQGSPAITVSWQGQGTGSVSLQQTNGFGCDTTVQVSVNILPQPTPVITGSTPVCAYQAALTYSTPFSAGNTYFWTVTGGVLTSGQGSASVTVAWGGQPGTGTLTVTETHFLGCDSTISLPVTLLPAPAPTINGSPFACAYSQSSYASNPDPAATITWSITGNGTILPGTSPELITIAWGAPGPAVLTVHYAYASGCDSSVSLPITIQSAPIPVMVGPDTVCQYSVHIYTTTAVPGVTYAWTPIGGTVISGQGTPSVGVSWSGFGNFSLELYAVAASGCDTTLSIPVHVLEGPLAVINPGDQTICQPGLVSFDGGASLGETGYQWTFGNGGSSSAPNPTSGFWVPGNYTIRLITTGPFACRDTAFATLHVQPGPYAEFTVLPGLEFIADIDTAAFVNFSTQPASYLWDFGDGLTDTLFEPQHYFAEPGDYLVTLLVTDSLGCTATYQQLLTVIWELNLFVPTAFTPNGDGLNDFFNVSHRNVLDFRFLIFSRWGELMFETRDKDFQWPGTYKSDPLPEGVYVWKLEATFLGESNVVRSGTVTLIR